ncbi:MAG: phospho-N-acetylmuramoyl-pentapeptide-transferase, partial [Lachnospiraceae bacterium]|nr:phospho-N-acetylmuramoyl-pentapeptide-transferase [Lachnospiraceae bacterium]
MPNGLIGKYILDIVLALAISAVATAALIPFLHKLKFGQQIREEGPQAHLKKAGTPTMGGIGFLLAILVCGIIFLVVSRDVRMVPVLLLTLLFGLIGFIDDFLKIVKKQSEGLNPKQKLLLQVAVAVAFIIILYAFGLGSSLRIPFLGREVHIPAPIFIFIALCAILGTDNAVNFTDGLDGL